MASHMTTFYGPQATQVNEELPQESPLNLTLMQHLRDENPEPRKCAFVLKLILFELGIITFLRTLAPW